MVKHIFVQAFLTMGFIGQVLAGITDTLTCPVGYAPGYVINYKNFWGGTPAFPVLGVDGEITVYATQKVHKTVITGFEIQPKADIATGSIVGVKQKYLQTKWIPDKGIYTQEPLRNYAAVRRGTNPGSEIPAKWLNPPEERKAFAGLDCDWQSLQLAGGQIQSDFCQVWLYGRHTTLYAKHMLLKDGRVYLSKVADSVEHKCLKEDEVAVPEGVVWE
ncbi:hypothetical protein [Aliamphritea spongicola]|uniref:hypothetical protein n=1 Tax=Aliamphritea spongicola TaxID=707589 RepID=UPI00196A3B2A|nr:hypothetical protein [Aliamphritea spongicola]MBN3564701.1 hypothetical protein [Aliamphritea spongicola]